MFQAGYEGSDGFGSIYLLKASLNVEEEASLELSGRRVMAVLEVRGFRICEIVIRYLEFEGNSRLSNREDSIYKPS